MLRTLLHHEHEQYDGDGIRLRGLGFSRLDGFSDVVFGFALTLIVVSLEVPKSFEELHHLWRAFLPFAVTFLLLMLIWYEHFIFFRRFGLHDAGTIWLNGLLLFVVLFYVYPLKFLFLSAFGGAAAFTSVQQFRELVLVFAGGQATIYFLIAGLYANALRQRAHLELTPLEAFVTRFLCLEELGTGCIGLLVCLLVVVLPAGHASWALFAFLLIALLRTAVGRYSRRVAHQMRASAERTAPLA